jgi:hypothetical protein
MLWTLGAVALEACARIQGYYDHWRKNEHHIWQIVASTKNLEADAYASSFEEKAAISQRLKRFF